MQLLPIDGGGLAPAPNGKTVAYIKRVQHKDQIYIFNFETGQDNLIVEDTLKKYAIGWSNDGKYLVYNNQVGKGDEAEIQICTFNIWKHRNIQITNNPRYRSYGPAWNPKRNKIAYFLEKGDQHDEIYLTDDQGSYHTDLTHDPTTHNYFPYRMNDHTIFYAQSPDYIMTIHIDGRHRKKVEGIRSTEFK